MAAGHSPNEHQKSRLIADDGDVSLARRGVLQSKHAPGTQLPRLAVGRGDGKATLQNDAELHCGRRMVELFSRSFAPQTASKPPKNARDAAKSLPMLIGGAGGAKSVLRSSTVTSSKRVFPSGAQESRA